MATVKHIKIHNSDYGATTEYLTMQHNEFTGKPVLDENGHMMERDFYLLEGINCDPDNFDIECEAVNEKYGKNQTYREIKAHHYIISFDPRDRDENGLTPEKAQALGLELARRAFPGHQVIVCTHKDGHNGAGNIHCHIVLNSVRKLDVPREDFMLLRTDNIGGFKHHSSRGFKDFFRQSVMDICQREGLYQVDLLSPARVRITDREYWAQRRGQAKLDAENSARIASGETPVKTKYETDNAILRRQIKSVLEDSTDYDDFCQKLLGHYGILIGESRGRINYLPADRSKPIRGRTLGADFEKEAIEAYFREKVTRTHPAQVEDPVTSVTPVVSETEIAPDPQPAHMTLIMQLQIIVEEQARPYAARSAKIRELKDMASTLAFCQENKLKPPEYLQEIRFTTQSCLERSYS